MPVITIELPPQSYENKQEIARIFTSELSRITGIPQEPIVIAFHEITADNIANGGVMLKEIQKPKE